MKILGRFAHGGDADALHALRDGDIEARAAFADARGEQQFGRPERRPIDITPFRSVWRAMSPAEAYFAAASSFSVNR